MEIAAVKLLWNTLYSQRKPPPAKGGKWDAKSLIGAIFNMTSAMRLYEDVHDPFHQQHVQKVLSKLWKTHLKMLERREEDLDPKWTEPALVHDYTACCCVPGPCQGSEKGSRGYPGRTHEMDDTDLWWKTFQTHEGSDVKSICCVENNHKCADAGQAGKKWHEAARKQCVPENHPPVAHACRSESGTMPMIWNEAHHWIDLGDTGCAVHLNDKGEFRSDASKGKYANIDCPFRESTRDHQAQRAFLLSFSRNRPCSLVDATHSCHLSSTPTLDMSGSRWEATLQPIQDYLKSYPGGARHFVCNTVRLAPLMWNSVGFHSGGGLRDESGQNYPRSFHGQVVEEHIHDEGSHPCALYFEFTEDETRLARRVLRAMLPTYELHLMPEGIQMITETNMQKVSVIMGSEYWQPLDFENEMERECGRNDDVKLAQDPIDEVMNARAMERGKHTCRQAFPCAFNAEEGACASSGNPYEQLEGCKCECVATLSSGFMEDFAAAIEAGDRAISCRMWSRPS